MKKYLVYCLIDPRNAKIRYVGKSCNGLVVAKRHMLPSWYNGKRTKHFHIYRWVRLLLNQEMKPIIKILKDCNNSKEVSLMEQKYIKEFRNRGYKLCNHTDGGEGIVGLPRTPEWIEKIRNSRKGFRHKQATREYLSLLNKGKSKNLTDEQRKRRSEIAKSRVKSKEFLNKGRRKIKDQIGRIYNSIVEAANSLNIKRPCYISNVLCGRAKTTNGYNFEYV